MIFVVTGDKDAGKTIYTYKLIKALQNRKLKIRGFLSLGVKASGHRKRFELLDIASLQKWPLAEQEMIQGHIACGRYFFNPDMVKRGETIISGAIYDDADLLVMDEIGHCETKGLIWDKALRKALASSCSLIVVMSLKNLEKIIPFYEIKDYSLIDISRLTLGEAVKLIVSRMVLNK
jgi:nucleoside-triphosphatase THEP1